MSPAATRSGTLRGGSVKSIGTSTSCVGTTQRLLTSKRTRETAAYSEDGDDRGRRREARGPEAGAPRSRRPSQGTAGEDDRDQPV